MSGMFALVMVMTIMGSGAFPLAHAQIEEGEEAEEIEEGG